MAHMALWVGSSKVIPSASPLTCVQGVRLEDLRPVRLEPQHLPKPERLPGLGCTIGSIGIYWLLR